MPPRAVTMASAKTTAVTSNVYASFRYTFYIFYLLLCNAVLFLLNQSFRKFAKTAHPQASRDVDKFVSSSEQIWRNFVLHQLAHQCILCSEWVPSEWESKQLIKHHNNPHDSRPSVLWSDNLCVCKKQIHHLDCFWLKYESSIQNIVFFFSEKVSSESGEKYAQITSSIYKQKQSKTNCGFWCERKTEDGFFFFSWRKRYYWLWTCILVRLFTVKSILMMDLFLTNTPLFTSQYINWWTGVVWIIVMFLSAVWTLILMAPIHCRGSIGEQVM